MFEHMTEQEAKKQILDMVGAYCDQYHQKKTLSGGREDPLRFPGI